MRTKILLAVGVWSVGTGLYIAVAPGHWYANVPGVQGTGPLNLHFVRDIALAFLVSGGALIWSAVRGDRSAGICGVAWLCCHAVFHIWIWGARGAPADLVALTNLLGIQLPAVLGLFAALAADSGEAGA